MTIQAATPHLPATAGATRITTVPRTLPSAAGRPDTQGDIIMEDSGAVATADVGSTAKASSSTTGFLPLHFYAFSLPSCQMSRERSIPPRKWPRHTRLGRSMQTPRDSDLIAMRLRARGLSYTMNMPTDPHYTSSTPRTDTPRSSGNETRIVSGDEKTFGDEKRISDENRIVS